MAGAIKSPSSVVEAVFGHAIGHPEKLCLADATGSLTYGQAWGSIVRTARILADLGVRKGSCVVLECSQDSRFMIVLLAAQLAGGVVVPIEKNASVSRRVEVASDVEARVHIGKERLSELEETEFRSFDQVCQREFDSRDIEDAAELLPDGESDAEILFSTGTTGKSKGVVITHRNNVAISENIIDGVCMKANNVEIIPMPLSHSHGLRSAYANLVNGSSVLIADGVLSLKNVFGLMDSYRATSMDLSPSMLSIMLKLSGNRLGAYAQALDYVQLGSAPLPEQDKRRLIELLPGVRLYNFYGSTEAGRTCAFEFSDASDKPYCIGRPAINARFVVVDENREQVHSSLEKTGLLAVAGGANMRCYFKDPELTRQTMAGDFIYTKDMGYIDEDGFVYMIGRQDDVINFGGVKVAPEEIESVVAKHPIVRDCACVPAADELTGQAPALCLVLEDGAEYDEWEFRRHLLEALEPDKQPKHIVVLEEIPRTFNGKIRRKELIGKLAFLGRGTE